MKKQTKKDVSTLKLEMHKNWAQKPKTNEEKADANEKHWKGWPLVGRQLQVVDKELYINKQWSYVIPSKDSKFL